MKNRFALSFNVSTCKHVLIKMRNINVITIKLK